MGKQQPLTIPMMNGEQFVKRMCAGMGSATIEDEKTRLTHIRSELIEKISKISCSDEDKRTSVTIENGTITIRTKLKTGLRTTKLPVKDYFENRLTVPLPERRCVIHAIEKVDRELSAKYGALIMLEETVNITNTLKLSKP